LLGHGDGGNGEQDQEQHAATHRPG
jgi:hypothetical protein